MRFNGILAGGLVIGWCAVATLAAAPKPGAKSAPPKGKPGAAAAQPKPAAAPKPARDPNVSPEAEEFFEKEVRPVLAEKCFGCHGPKIAQSGLRVDTLAGLIRGMDGGRTALVPGDPAKSPLIQVLSHAGPVKMPPGGKLEATQIAALEQWVKMGAPWPGQQSADAGQSAKPEDHWAFKPVRKPAAPVVKNKTLVKNPIDAFVLKRLEAKGLTFSKPADRATLIRRAYFDLIGLPPTAEEIQAFVNDKSPDAYEKVIEKLLASPHYGERWARYWLDIARYADTKGYVFQEERRYPFSYTYRDWVINALNEDLPYDQFLIKQIAADHVVPANDKSDLAAMGFLTLGRRFLNNIHDIIDDRMDTVMRGTQGLTVACARCHDHKFDPIPTADYYSLYGVFASSTEPKDLPLIAQPERNAAYLAYEKRLNELEGEVQKFLQTKHGEIIARGKAKIGASLLAVREASGPGADMRGIAQKYELPGPLIARWRKFFNENAGQGHAIFGPWHRFAALPDAEFAAKAPALAKEIAGTSDAVKVNPHVAKLFAGAPPASLQEVAERYAKLLASPPGEDQQLVHALDSIGGPLNIEVGEVEQFFLRDDRNRIQALRQKVDAFKATSPAAPPRAMVLVDNPQPVMPRVFKRGNPNMPGDTVPRQFLAVLSGPERKPFTQGSGRLELARSIASKENPLTARVMANRIWHYHFGSPLVGTPSDFGVRSDPPTNPELLDFLASYFMENGWSIKKMHRLMMLSTAYRQGSEPNAAAAKVDPENGLYWRMNRRRMDFEAMRDSLLAAAGRLDRTAGGAAFDLEKQPFTLRRTVFGFIDRQNLPNLFRTFDFANPDQTSPMRYSTTVPQQALFMMNSPFVVEQAKALAAHPKVTSQKQAAEKVQQLYRLAYGRAPAPDEMTLGLRFLKSAASLDGATAEEEKPIWQYGYGAVDAATGKVKSFAALPHFTGQAWQGGPELPDPKLGWVILNAQGGHAGNDQAHAAIRRWTAPRDGAFRITGLLKHGRPEGDGVQARILSSRAGLLGTWTAHDGQAEAKVDRVEVKQGDTIDFVVDCRTNSSHDSFTWSPVLQLLGEAAGSSTQWSAASGFGGPASAGAKLSAWEKYAQVLLLSNEFMFVD